jgi:hypothetical protein
VTATAGTTGPTTYATLGAAFTAINSGTHQGVITIAIVGDTNETTATATLNASGSGAASYTSISIQPSGGAARTISGATTAGSPMIDFSGADNVTVDGLNSGGNSLTISNTTASATSGTSTIRFIGGATSNTITNCNLQGSVSSSVATNGAIVFFSTDAITTNGNDNNTISNNNIGPAGANLPTKAILGNGSTTTTAIGNSGIIINNNNIFDYFGAAVTSAGVATNGGCNTWSITNNRFYQTGTRTWTTGALHNAILLNNTTSTSGAQGFTVTGNIIGFGSNTQTGTYTLTGSTGKFVGIQFNGITGGTLSSISTNTVAAVSLTGVTSSGTSTSTPFTGIIVVNGLANTNSNVIGSQAATGSLTFSTTTTTSTDVYGIFNFSVDDWTANSNNVGGISVTNLGASGTFIIYAMRANTSTSKVFNATSNLVGGTVANSIQLTSTGAASQVVGMATSNAISTWTSNTARNLASNNGTGTTTAASVIGMLLTTTTPNQTVSQNTIFGLTNTSTTLATVVTGIQFTGGTANLVARNLIYGVTTASNSAAAEVNGIRVGGGTTIYRNNMIAVGAGITNAIGTGSTTGGVNGINEPAAGTDSFFHNSVYVGGAPTAGVGPSYAFNSSQVTNTRSFRDNIFFNARSNSGATGKNYAVRVGGTTPNPTGLTINNNVYFANGSGAVFGFFNSLDVANLAAWVTAVGQDANSLESNPQYLDPTNATPDLHINPAVSTVIEGNGADVGVTDDFDGQTRSGLTPVDIGADAGNFMGVDLAAPAISYTPLANTTSTTNRALAAMITDAVSGVPTSGVGLPVIYFRKGTSGAYSSTQSVSGGGGTYNFTIDYSLVTGGSVMVGDTIQYFVVAQDGAATPNVTSNPSAGASGYTANPPAATTPPATPNSYLIAAPIAGIKTICASGCEYTTLTGAAGVFSAINTGVVTGNVEIQIAGDLTAGEDGTNGLNAFSEQPSGSNFTVKIYPTGVARAITGSFNGALIRMNGSSRVTVDGSIGGTGIDRSLTITNTSVTSPSVVLLGSTGTTAITNDTLKNCVVINGVNTSSAVVVSDAGTLGNAGFFSNITIQNNDVQKAFVGVFATGGTSPQNGSNLTYTQNTVNTSGANAVRSVALYMQGVNGATVSNNTVGNLDKTNDENDVGIWLASGTINATVSGNTVASLGYTGTSAFAPIGINVTPATTGTNNNVTGNSVSDITTNGGTQVRGISVSGASSDLTIQKNNVQGINNLNTGTFGAYGIDISAGNNIVVKNNFVSNVNFNMTGGAAFSTTFGVFGIRIGAGNNIQVYNNSVNLYGALPGTAATSLLSAAFALVGTGSTGCDVRNNVFANNITGGTTSIAHVSAYLPSGGSSAMNLNWNNNAYYFGTDSARQGVGQAGTTAGTNFFTTLAALTAYSSTLSAAGTNDNASQASTSAPPFISNNDLHITNSNSLLSAGAAIASVTADYDSDPRPATMPDIGADELVQAEAGTIPGGTFYNALTADGDSLGGNVSITNVIYLNGKLSTGASTLAIGCNATVSGGGASNYVIGNLKKAYCATGSKSFEVGTANGFSPATINITAGTFPADFTVKAVQGAQPNIAVPAKALQRYWTLTGSGITADLTFNYLDPIDIPVTANEAAFVIFKHAGSFSMPGGSVNTGANTATINGVISFSDWTLAEPSAEPCPISTTPTSQNFLGSGGSNSFTVTADGACVWNAVPNAVWITIDSVSKPTGGHAGNGTVNYSVAANPGGARMSTITVGVQTFTVNQDTGCSYMLDATSHNFVAPGGSSTVGVTAPMGCGWTAVSNDGFIVVDTGTPGSGNGSVGYHVTANTGPARMGTMTIAGITFTVTQDSGCTFTLSRDHESFPGAGGSGSVNVTASNAACPWAASTNATFIHITSGTPGAGNGTLQYTVDANPGSTIRSDTITVAGNTYTVYQGIDFVDVPADHLFYNEIGILAARGVTLGCTLDHTQYCPNDSVLREQMAAFILRAKGEFSPPNPASQRFIDVPPTNVFYNFIDRLAVLGITVGCNPPDNTMYCPSSAVTREQMAAFILRGLGEFDPPTPASQRFLDVPPSNVFYNFIDRMAVLNITVGCTPDHMSYCPGDPVTRGQMAAFLVRAFDL